MKMISIIAVALFVTPAFAQVANDELAAAYKACEPHQSLRPAIGEKQVARPKWDEGWEGCAKINEAWALSEPARVDAELKAKVDALAKKLGR